MTSYHSRPFAGVTDIPLLLDFARAGAGARPPGLAYWHPGDITWQLWNLGASEDVRLWTNDSGLAGFAAFEPPTVAQVDLRPGESASSSLLAEMLDWAEERRLASYRPGETVPIAYSMFGDRSLAVNVFDHDAERIEVIDSRGYERVDRFGYHYVRGLAAPTPAPPLPAGSRLRHVLDVDVEERIDLHRDAWSVWGPSSATVDAYRRLRRAPNYDETLDIVVEDSDGRFLSYCICWADEKNGIGSFEPVGTRPAVAGRGLGKLVLYEGLRRLRDRGLHSAIVGTASVNARAAALYTSVGFELAGLDHFWVKQL